MNTRRTVLRRIARATASVGAVGSAAMLAVTAFGPLAGMPRAAAATVGTATIVTPFDGTPGAGQPLTTGGSNTPFSLLLPGGAACTGDSANSDYRVQSYMVPSSVDPSSLTYDFSGPLPNGLGASLRQPLYQTSSSAYVNAQTADNTTPNGPGPIVAVPAFSLGVYSPGNIPAGEYNLGIACTLGPASGTQLDKLWNVQITVTADTGDQPAQIAWTAGGGSSTTTTTSGESTTTTGGGSTTTTDGGSTTTTDGGSTTTSIGDGTTTTTEAAFVSGGGEPSGTSVAGTTTMPVTGGSPLSLLVWSVLFLGCGRAVLLLGRPARVRPAET